MRTKLTFSLIFAPLSLSLCAACTAQAGAEAVPTAQTGAAVHPESGLPVIPLTVMAARGKHVFKVEVAATAAAQAKGLMFRTELGPDEGMIFPRDGFSQASFWMKNTPLALDIIFIGVDGRISNIAANTVPYSLDPVSSAGLASGVLEIRGGRAAALGIAAGDKVKW